MKHLTIILSSLLAVFSLRAQPADSLVQKFQSPPAVARPWVYWFWNNGNVTSNGITADLEAMQRVGIGGVLIMDVVERFAPPQGTAEFMNTEWQNLFQFSVQEAARLGLEINMANGPGWCGSSGPWITPELSMQKIVCSSTVISGPTNFSAVLPQPNTGAAKKGHDMLDSSVKYQNYYEDIAVLAIPQTTNGIVPRSAVVDLTAKLGADGKLNWEVPAGNWVIQRIGHTTTGSSTRPPVVGGNGLECDKLSAAAMDAHFAGQMAKLIKTAGPLAGKSLTATHIDSWEVGSQNWTPKMREEFQKRRGYDLLPWLPCLTDAGADKKNHLVMGDAAMTARFRWDFDQTRAELLAENYSGRMAQLAHKHGLRYSLEGYNLPFGDEFTYTARADEPMTEFWTAAKFGQNETWRKAEEMASVAHVYGHAICGAESFTSGEGEMWKLTPAEIKSLGDYEFSQGVNRFVVHRYAHQPYLDRVPGATMGPWGLHYERTQTWWEMSGAWHAYLARCQYLLRQGKFVADLLYLRPEVPNQTYFTPSLPPPAGYRFDEISAEALMQRVSIKDGKLVLPDGMNYRVLVLPSAKTMTPTLLKKIRDLTRAGATVVVNGPRPQTSPSLTDFPKCDEAVAKTAGEIWGDCDGKLVTEHALKRGRVVWGQPLEQVLTKLGSPADFAADAKLNWIHRLADGAEIYFVANPSKTTVETRCTFRVNGLRPELWNPETGETTLLATYENSATGITVPLRFGPSESAFVVFRKSAKGFDPVVKLLRNGQPLSEFLPKPADLKIVSASYGVPGDAARTRDVLGQVQELVNQGKTMFQVAELAKAGDPAYGIVKTLAVEYVVAGKTFRATGQDPDNITLDLPVPELPAEILCDAAGHLLLSAREPGRYEWVTASGKSDSAEVSETMPPVEITGPWQLSFPPKWGAPESVTLTNLISWPDSADAGVKYFSGTATYRTTFDFPNSKFKTQNSKIFLTLGDVRVMARVKVNGRDCGIAWHPPFRVEITGAARPGTNVLEIQVANQWPNRMIGDAALPAEKRFTWSSWEPFKPNTPLLPSGLLGPVKVFCESPGGDGNLLPDSSPTNLPTVSEGRVKQLQDLHWGMFVCWSFSTFSGKEWTPGVTNIDLFAAKDCDTDQWVKTAKDAGMGYVLFLTKHHDGFCLWDTRTTDRKVTRAPLGRDVLAELKKSCDKYGLKLALYFSEGEWAWPDKPGGGRFPNNGGYNPEMKKAQLKELLTQYGPIEYIWFDHAVGDGGLSHAETVKWVKSFQPGCFVGFNHGEAAGDIRLGEMGRPGPVNQKTGIGADAGGANYSSYQVAEFTYPILPKHKGGAMWFYSLPEHDHLCLPAEKIYADYLGAVKYGNIFSLDVGPDYNGRLRAIDVETLQQVGDMIRAKAPAPVPPTSSSVN